MWLQFFESGLERLTGLLGELLEASDKTQIDNFLHSAGEVLRLLASVLQPLRIGGSLPTISSAVHRKVIARLCDCFMATLAKFSSEDDNHHMSFYRLFERIMLLLRLAQFHVAFQVKDTSHVVGLISALVSLLAVS